MVAVGHDPHPQPVDLGEDVGLKHRGGRPLGENRPTGEDGKAVAEAGGQVEVVQGDDGEAAGVPMADPAHMGEHRDLAAQVEGGGGFVEQDESGLAHERLGQGHELALPAGELAQWPVGQLGHTELVQSTPGQVDVGAARVPGHPAPRGGEHRLQGGQDGIARKALRHVADHAAQVAAPAPLEGHLPQVAAQLGHAGDQGGLAGTVGAEQAHHLSRLPAGVDALEDRAPAVGEGEIVQRQGHEPLLTAERWRPKMMARNTGTPTSAVRMPTGTATPGTMT